MNQNEIETHLRCHISKLDQYKEIMFKQGYRYTGHKEIHNDMVECIFMYDPSRNRFINTKKNRFI